MGNYPNFYSNGYQPPKYDQRRTPVNNAPRPASVYEEQRREELGEPAFIQARQGRAVVFRGIVAGKEPYQKYRTKGEKYADAVFRGAPYDYGPSSNYTIIRIEEIASRRLATNQVNVLFAGNPGVFEGDDIIVEAKLRGGVYYADRIVLNNMGTVIMPSAQLPAGTVKFGVFAIIALVIFAIIFVASGDLLRLLTALGGGLMSLFFAALPLILLFGLGWYFLRKLIGR